MPKILQLRRGTTAEISANTPASGELFVDTDKKTVTVGDGATAGGIILARDDRVSDVYNTANAVNVLIGVDVTQNTRLSSIETINTNQNTSISIIQGVDLTQNTNITAINQFAVSAFDKANTGGTFTGNVTIQQNLTVANNSSANSYSINGSQYIGINRAITYYGTTHNALGSGSGSRTIDLSLGNFVSSTITGATTWTFTNPIASPAAIGFVLELTNGGSATQTWPASVKWPGGTAPTLTVSGIDVLTFFTDDGGTNWRGVVSMLDSK